MADKLETRELILGILLEVNKEGKYSHLVIRNVLEKYQYLDKQDRAFITRVSEGTIQRQVELDYIIDQFSKTKTKKMKPVILNILRMAVYQLKYMDSVHSGAACNEAVKLAKKHGFSSLSGFVNGVLRNISRNLENITYPDREKEPAKALSVIYSMPEWLTEKWIKELGFEKTEKLLADFLSDAPITVRTNLTKITPQELNKKFEEENVKAEILKLDDFPKLDYAFKISEFDYLGKLESFKEGLFYVQDISSMLVTELADPASGATCIDVCAAPGGKAIHMAEKLSGSGMVFARDLTENKVELIRENIERIGLKNIKAEQADATVFDKASENKADVLICDLPCSGLGILRKKSDIKYKTKPEDIEELAKLQRNILETVHSYVKPGGTMVYSTCTIAREENGDNVEWFVKNHPEFEVEYEKQILPETGLGDGFFICKMKKHE